MTAKAIDDVADHHYGNIAIADDDVRDASGNGKFGVLSFEYRELLPPLDATLRGERKEGERGWEGWRMSDVPIMYQ